MAQALVRWQKLNGAMAAATGKVEGKREEERRRRRRYSVARKQREATKEPSPRQHEAEDGHVRAWNQEEGHRR